MVFHPLFNLNPIFLITRNFKHERDGILLIGLYKKPCMTQDVLCSNECGSLISINKGMFHSNAVENEGSPFKGIGNPGSFVNKVVECRFIQNSVDTAKPEKVPLFGGFEAWRDMVGGVLEHSGVPDFLKNAVDIYLEGDADLREEETFISALHETFKDQTWTVRDLMDVLKNETVVPGKLNLAQCLPERLSATWKKGEDSFSKTAGKALRRYAGKRYPCGLMIEKHDQDKTTKVWIWRIKDFTQETPQDANDSKQNPEKPGNPDDENGDSRGLGVFGVSCSRSQEKIKENSTSRSHVRIGCSKTPETPQTPLPFIVVRILHDLEPFQGIDGKVYECRRGDLVTLPEPHARVFVDKGYAVLVTPEEGRGSAPVVSPVKPIVSRNLEEIG